MKTEQINLTSTYTYIRCDAEFALLFTNGQTMPMWRGFYCFRTEQLQEYNTNGQLIIQSNDDNCNMWWLCTNTLIMSVTDINNEALNGIGQLVSGLSEIEYQNALANLNQLTNNDRTNNLLESIQNSFSIFLNAYVEANNVQDFGYITGTINNDFTCNVYIAKANKYSFNCGITFERNFSNGQSASNSMTVSQHSIATFDNSIFFDISLTATDGKNSGTTTFKLDLGLKKNLVQFALYNNLNEIQSGYAVSNVSSSASFKSSSIKIYQHAGFNGVLGEYTKWDSFYTFNKNFSNLALYSSPNFSLTLSDSSTFSVNNNRVSYSAGTSLPSQPLTEKLVINFDVDKT